MGYLILPQLTMSSYTYDYSYGSEDDNEVKSSSKSKSTVKGSGRRNCCGSRQRDMTIESVSGSSSSKYYDMSVPAKSPSKSAASKSAASRSATKSVPSIASNDTSREGGRYSQCSSNGSGDFITENG